MLDLPLSINQNVLSDTVMIVVQYMALPPCFHTDFCSKCFQTDTTSCPPILPVVITLVPLVYPSPTSYVSSIAQLTPIPQHHNYIASTINSEVGGMCVHYRFGALTWEVSDNTVLSGSLLSYSYYT
jgi:hypothetical protein